MLPIIRQMHDAPDARRQADILLRAPLSVLLKYSDPLVRACRRTGFDEGEAYCDLVVASLLSVRDADGNVPDGAPLRALQQALARYAAGG